MRMRNCVKRADRVRGRRPRRAGGVMVRGREGVQGRKPSRVRKRDKPQAK